MSMCTRCGGQIVRDQLDETDLTCITCGHKEYNVFEPATKPLRHILDGEWAQIIALYDEVLPHHGSREAAIKALAEEMFIPERWLAIKLGEREALLRTQHQVKHNWSWIDVKRRYAQMEHEGYPNKTSKYRELMLVYGMSASALKYHLTDWEAVGSHHKQRRKRNWTPKEKVIVKREFRNEWPANGKVRSVFIAEMAKKYAMSVTWMTNLVEDVR